MADNIWASLSKQLGDSVADAGKSVVAVQGTRHPASGVVLAKDAVVTVNHAVKHEDEVTVVFSPDKRVTARVAGRDPSTDLAVLRLQQSADAPPARWGKTDDLCVGDFVLAVARSWRGNVVASSGILSGLIAGPWRTWRGGGELNQFIRPDLTLYPGFSGGPLVGSSSEFLGINTAGLHSSGITVPAATVVSVAAQLLEKGHMDKPWLGLTMQSVPLPESLRGKLNLTGSEGLLVAHTEPGSPAEKGGVLLGDVLVELGGKPVSDTDAVQDVLRAKKVGEAMSAALVRAGSMVRVQITLEARPQR